MKYLEYFLLCAILVPTAICMGAVIFMAAVEIWLRGWERFGRWKRHRHARWLRKQMHVRLVDPAYSTKQFSVPYGQKDWK